MDALAGTLVALARAGMTRAGAAAGRISLAALCVMLASAAATASAGCGLTALWIVMLPRVGPAWSALILSGVLALMFVALLALAWSIVRRVRRTPRVEARADVSLLAAAQLFNQHKAAMLLAALVAGLGAGSGGGNR